MSRQSRKVPVILRIDNTPRPYNWGSDRAIADLLGREPSGGPEAELWLGAHPGSPSRIVDGAAEGDLAAWARHHRPDARLPFLMKVLAASSSLSLQAHPRPQQAREGFERENANRVPFDAAHRNYKDPFHKPELLYALSDPFRAISGFRPVAESRVDLKAADDARLAALIGRLTGEAALPGVVAWLLAGGAEVSEIVAALTQRADELCTSPGASPSWDTVQRLAAEHPGDAGIAISMLMHTVVLRPGEAIYLPAGNIHAYLEGLGLEVMAASDNVLRGGLTTKHVDVPELMSVLDFRSLPAPYLTPEHPREGVSVFRPDVPDFTLTLVTGESLAEGFTMTTGGAAILLCIEGAAHVVAANDEVGAATFLRRGEAAFCDEKTLFLQGRGTIAVASGT